MMIGVSLSLFSMNAFQPFVTSAELLATKNPPAWFGILQSWTKLLKLLQELRSSLNNRKVTKIKWRLWWRIRVLSVLWFLLVENLWITGNLALWWWFPVTGEARVLVVLWIMALVIRMCCLPQQPCKIGQLLTNTWPKVIIPPLPCNSPVHHVVGVALGSVGALEGVIPPFHLGHPKKLMGILLTGFLKLVATFLLWQGSLQTLPMARRVPYPSRQEMFYLGRSTLILISNGTLFPQRLSPRGRRFFVMKLSLWVKRKILFFFTESQLHEWRVRCPPC